MFDFRNGTMKNNSQVTFVAGPVLFMLLIGLCACSSQNRCSVVSTCENLAALKAGDAVILDGKKVVVKQMDILPVVRNDYSRRFVFDSYENPKLQKLRRQEQLDKVTAAGKTEFDRQVLLLDWVYHRFKKFGAPTSQASGALDIVNDIDAGHTFFCNHYARVMVGTAAALGWLDRLIAVRVGNNAHGSGVTEHSITEIWSNQYGKWIMFDPTFALYVEKNGIPLGAWEIRQNWFYGDPDSLDFVIGAQRKKYKGKDMPIFMANHPGFGDLTLTPRTIDKLAFLGYIPNTDLMDRGPDYAKMFITKDSLCDGIRWHLRDNPQDPAREPYFPLNQAALTLTPAHGLKIDVGIDTFTPNFAAYRYRIDQQNWRQGKPDQWLLHPGKNSLQVVSVNKFGIEGSPARAVLVLEKSR